MNTEADRPEDSEPPAEIDRGLELGFGGRRTAESHPTSGPSVVRRIGEVTGRQPAISLRDVDVGQTPILKPLAAGGEVARETGIRYGGVLYVDSLSDEGGLVPTYLDLLKVTTGTIVEGLTGQAIQ